MKGKEKRGRGCVRILAKCINIPHFFLLLLAASFGMIQSPMCLSHLHFPSMSDTALFLGQLPVLLVCFSLPSLDLHQRALLQL